MKKKQVTRNFPGSDANMLQRARLIHTHLTEDQASFTAKDPDITPAWAGHYLSDIETTEQMTNDDVARDELAGKTAHVLEIIDQVRDLYDDVRYYVQKAFKTSREIQNQFGLNDYDRAMHSQGRTQQFLYNMHATALKYSNTLLAAGLPSSQITAIETLANTLRDEKNTQLAFKDQRPVNTAARVSKLNEVYEQMTRINALAQVLYRRDAERRAMFVFQHSSASGTDSEEQVYRGTISGTAILHIATIPYAGERGIAFRNTGISTLEFALAASADTMSPGKITMLAGGTDASGTMQALDGDESVNFLNVRCMSKQPGSYEVIVGRI